MTLLFNIVQFNSGTLFYRLSNEEGKAWLLPAKNMRTALALYQSGSKRGRLLKRWLPLLHRVTAVCRYLKMEQMQLDLHEPLRSKLQELFQCTTFEFALYEGTPSVNQKITIQISSGRTILGYCKVTDNASVAELFHKEHLFLKWLKEKGVVPIPHVLYCGSDTNSLSLFVQDTRKTIRATRPHRLTPRHWAFLQELDARTEIPCRFATTDFCKALNRLECYLESLSAEDARIVQTALRRVRQHYRQKYVAFSVYHADFTPWNTYMTEHRVFAFDFEYAARTCPPYMDACNFILQTAIQEFKYSAEKTYRYFRMQTKSFPSDIDDPYFLCLCSLLYTLSFYYHLRNGSLDTTHNGYRCCIALAKILVEQKR
ncbi:MAG: aminoglycoside phosphotransferase family protein [Prevotellaceae bacterium]|jgi:hypothetical protein|nr:aminoglycoside phosphotransferase family protein [Prevotellaceae bacterium]